MLSPSPLSLLPLPLLLLLPPPSPPPPPLFHFLLLAIRKTKKPKTKNTLAHSVRTSRNNQKPSTHNKGRMHIVHCPLKKKGTIGRNEGSTWRMTSWFALRPRWPPLAEAQLVLHLQFTVLHFKVSCNAKTKPQIIGLLIRRRRRRGWIIMMPTRSNIVIANWSNEREEPLTHSLTQ